MSSLLKASYFAIIFLFGKIVPVWNLPINQAESTMQQQLYTANKDYMTACQDDHEYTRKLGRESINHNRAHQTSNVQGTPSLLNQANFNAKISKMYHY